MCHLEENKNACNCDIFILAPSSCFIQYYFFLCQLIEIVVDKGIICNECHYKIRKLSFFTRKLSEIFFQGFLKKLHKTHPYVNINIYITETTATNFLLLNDNPECTSFTHLKVVASFARGIPDGTLPHFSL